MTQPKFGSLQEAVGNWAKGLRLKATHIGLGKHLQEEVDEVRDELEFMAPNVLSDFRANHLPHLAEECADVLIMLAHVANSYGFDLIQAGWDKHLKNLNRKWSEPDEDGVIHHIKEPGHANDDLEGSVRPSATAEPRPSTASHQASRSAYVSEPGHIGTGDGNRLPAAFRYANVTDAASAIAQRVARKGYYVTLQEVHYFEPTTDKSYSVPQEAYSLTYSPVATMFNTNPKANRRADMVLFLTLESALVILDTNWLDYLTHAKFLL